MEQLLYKVLMELRHIVIIGQTKKRKQPDEHSLRVFDLDKNEWRSFRFDRLQKVGAEISLETK